MANTPLNVKYDAGSRVVPFYTPVNITTVTTTVISTTRVFLHTVTLNKPVATGTIGLLDVTPGVSTTTYGTITVPASPQPVTLHYDMEFPNGLTVTSQVAAQDITVSYLN